MERSGQEPKQEAKPAVDAIDQHNKANPNDVSVPGSPHVAPSRGWQNAAAAAPAAPAPLPPPRSPEKRNISAAMSPGRSSAVLDRRASTATNARVPPAASMERSGQESKQEAKPAVDAIAQHIKANPNDVSVSGSPDVAPSRGWQNAAAAAPAAPVPLPPPRTPEKRNISAAMSPERSSAVLDRRASAATNSGVPGTPTKSGDEIAADASAMPPPPTTPKRKGRRALPRSRAPAKPRTPTGGLAALRMGQGEDEEDGGKEAEGKLTPSKEKLRGPSRALEMTPTKKVKGRAFGRTVDGSPCRDRVAVPGAVSRVYSLVQKATGSVGGNGNTGAIYGELTVGCMQKVVNVLKEETGFDANSSFIDVGSGLGKPNFHVAQDPGCEISYGLELEEVRWQLSVVNHRFLLRDGVVNGTVDAGVSFSETLDAGDNGGVSVVKGVDVQKHNLFFAHGDILSAKSFDPFTHVYMFDIGFPPVTLRKIAEIFNNSQARHLISYQVPKKVLDYGFKVDHILKMPLSLTGSGEGHTMYLYRRKYVEHGLPIDRIMQVDPFFAEGVSLCRDGGDGSRLADHVERKFRQNTSGGIRTRSRSRRVQS